MTRSPEATSDDHPRIDNQWYEDWVKDNVPDQTNKVIVVTGANSGTGFWAANALAGKGATVVLACRNLDKAEAAKKEILENYPEAKVDVIKLDNGDLSSVRSFAESFDKKYDRLDVLANNAGVMALPYSQTKDGFEIQFQTNHLAHFLLTRLLWPKLLSAPGQSRVVQHSSGAHHFGAPKFSKDRMENPPYGWSGIPMQFLFPFFGFNEKPNWRRYGTSKLANVLFMNELASRIQEKERVDKVVSLACHPGYASTNLQAVAGEHGAMSNWQKSNESNAQSAADGSLPLLMSCVGEGVSNGDYYGPTLKMEMQGPPGKAKVKGFGNDKGMMGELWNYSEECIGDKFDV